jgi:hypothetical protein
MVYKTLQQEDPWDYCSHGLGNSLQAERSPKNHSQYTLVGTPETHQPSQPSHQQETTKPYFNNFSFLSAKLQELLNLDWPAHC